MMKRKFKKRLISRRKARKSMKDSNLRLKSIRSRFICKRRPISNVKSQKLHEVKLPRASVKINKLVMILTQMENTKVSRQILQQRVHGGRFNPVKMSTIKILKENILAYHTVPKSVVSSVAGWSTTYFLIKRITGQEPEWAVRVVTAVHATLITILAVVDWSFIRHWNIEDLGKTNSKYEEAILCLTLGYFFFDMIWIIKYQTEGPAMYFHHTASIFCLSLILAKGTSAPEVLVGISGLELTNPCLQARWFLRSYGYQGTWIYLVVEFIFMSTFLIFRIFYGTYLTYNIILHPKCHLVLKVGTICLYAVSWAFAYQMISYVSKRYIKSKTLKEKD